MKKRMRILSIVLALVMTISLLPVSAFAEELEDDQTTEPIEATDTLAEEPGEVPEEESEEATTEDPVDELAADPAEEPAEETTGEPVEGDLAQEPTAEPAEPMAAGSGFTGGYTPIPGGYNKLISEKTYAITPGITEYDFVLNDASGNNQNVCYAMEVDLSNPQAKAAACYSNMDPSHWVQQVTSEQARIYEEKTGENVVGAINVNLSWASDEPIGMLVINGVKYHEAVHDYAYLAIDKNGKAEIRDGNVPLRGDEWQAITTFQLLARNGVNLAGEESHVNAERAPRTCIGIKADGTLLVFVNDGRQAPRSVGMTCYEMAETMLALGCVDVANCDGGGSSTFLSEREGSGKLTIKNTPSDGAERPTLGTLMIISKAVSTGEFDHASLTPEDELYTPGSTVQFNAVGVDEAGGSADLPADAKWELSAESASLGTIDETTGLFTGAEDATGVVTANLVSGGKVVGSTSVELVKPDEIYFSQEEVSLGFEEESDLNFVVLYQGTKVNYKDGDFIWTVSDERLGSFRGNIFVSADGNSLTGTVTATSVFDSSVTASTTVIVGMLPTIVWDFEDYTVPFAEDGVTDAPITIGEVTYHSGDVIPAATYYNSILTHTNYGRGGEESFEIVSIDQEEPVRMGTHSLKLNYNFINAQDSTEGACIGTTEAMVIPGRPTAIGCYVYVPEGTESNPDGCSFWLRGYVKLPNGTTAAYDFTLEPKACGPNDQPGTYWTGWKYCEASLAAWNDLPGNFAIPAGMTFRLMYVHGIKMGTKSAGSMYFDNLQFVYGTNVDDVDNPEIGKIAYITDYSDVALNEGEVIHSNKVSFTAQMSDVQNKYTSGLNPDTVRVYIDGINTISDEFEYAVSPSGSNVSVYNVQLLNGPHSVTVSVRDMFGNETSETRHFTIDGTEQADIPVVSAVPRTETAPLGGKQYIDIVATDASLVKDTYVQIKMDKMFPDFTVEYAPGYAGEFTYNKFSGMLRLNAAANGEAKNGNVIATIAVTVPDTLGESVSLNYEVKSGKYTTNEDVVYTFSAPNVAIPVQATYELSSGVALVGEGMETVITVTKDGAPAAGIGVYKDDGTLIGTTDENGQLVTNVFNTQVGSYSIRAMDDEGSVSYYYTVKSYAPYGTDAVPFHVMYNAAGDATTMKNISWQTNPVLSGKQQIKYAPVGSDSYTTVDAETTLHTYVTGDPQAVNINRVTLTGLTPNTEYKFMVGSGDAWSAEKTFKTEHAKQGVKFFVLGDIQITLNDETANTNINNLDRYIKTGGYHFGIQTGDAVDDATMYAYWNGLTDRFSSYGTDVIHVLGNHEYAGEPDAASSRDMFNLAESQMGSYYSATYGDVYVAVINYFATDEQLIQALEWLKQDAAASDATWKILTLHQPPYYTNANGGNAQVWNLLPPVADEVGLDFVFSGHDHSYARTLPMTDRKVDEDGTVYFICGSSGEKSYTVIPNEEFNFAKADNNFNAIYLDVKADSNEFTVTAYDVQSDGSRQVYDTYTAAKGDFCANGEHTYNYDYDTGVVTCSKCGYHFFAEDREFTGLVFDPAKGEYRYLYLGQVATGWRQIDDDWYYFRIKTKTAATGIFHLNGIDFHFEKTGRLIKGEWKVMDEGTRYYYGPSYYRAMNNSNVNWQVIDGKTYGFGRKGYRYEGMCFTKDSHDAPQILNVFGDDGVYVGPYTGIYESYYYVDGQIAKGVGLIQIGEDYYYVNQDGKIYVGSIYLSEEMTNGIFPAGWFEFGEDGKLLLRRGIVDGYYYENNALMKGKGLIKLEGDYYYVGQRGQIYVGGLYVSEAKANGLMPAGKYQFGADGKMILKSGIVDGYYYENNKLVKGKGLIQIGEDYYYIGQRGQVYVGGLYVSEEMTNGLMPAGKYQFADDGKMILKNGIVDGYYYENNVLMKNKGLIQIGGDYYYVGQRGQIYVGGLYVSEAKANGLVPAGKYVFGADGKMIIN